MYTGHFAVGLALHAVAPRGVSARSLLLGVGALDLLNGIFTAVGLNHVTPAPDEAVGFLLDRIDWDHSLVMALVWALACGLVRVLLRLPGAALVALAVFSHLPLDALVHRPDLALWPGAPVRIGLDLWHLFPQLAWVFELLLAGAAFAFWASRRGAALGPRRFWILGLLLGMHVSYAPALMPLRMVARSLAAPLATQVYCGVVFISFLAPAWLMGGWLRPLERTDQGDFASASPSAEPG
ncbi:MAG TPA: hypothetical protein VFH51_11975 [Myxococcota bacterium]|nr:hypothetical protein [Myxococcota bacterium]